MQKLKGNAITELVEGGRLKRADVLLARYKRSFYGWVIRLTTRCYWNHAFLIYMVADPDENFDRALIIDPKMGSIHMEDLAYYLAHPERYDVAVKRLEQAWFQNDDEDGGRLFQRMVCNVALRETADKYDTRVVKYLRKVARLTRLAYRYTRRRLKYPGRRKRRSLPITRRLKINTYSCSGFVQWSYHQGVSRVLKDYQDKTPLQDVIFRPQSTGEPSDYDLLSATPADLANSDKLSWKYIVKDGIVWEVSDKETVDSILRPRKKKP